MADEWFYAQDGQRQGPVTQEQLIGLIRAGSIRPQDLVWTEGMPQWEPVAQIAPLAREIAPAPCPQQMPPPQPVGYYQPVGPSYIAGFVCSLTVPIVGIILSLIALSGIKKSGNNEGRGLALAGAIISRIWVGLAVLFFLCFRGAFFAAIPAGSQGF